MAAEYVVREGNAQVILCERGIKTFETSTRFTLDIGAIPVLKQETHLPVIVDPSHAAGRRDLVLPLARAAVAAGADGIIVEVHPRARARAVRRGAADPGRGVPAVRRRDPRALVPHGRRRVKVAPAAALVGDVAVPGTKSISHRALLLRRDRARGRATCATSGAPATPSRRSPRYARSASSVEDDVRPRARARRRAARAARAGRADRLRQRGHAHAPASPASSSGRTGRSS